MTKIDKGTSEKYFIDIIYNCLVSKEDSRSDKEKLARLALNLHKVYWDRCEQHIKETDREKANNS